WTNAVVLMAADALYGLTPGARLFDHDAWDGYTFKF
ncbi:MAG TPA: phenyltransferase domain-containing protein, partial [Desulfobacter sp.]|nr:phenyltransferase domain-containing protein [Desulfobacter sp.]